MQFRKFDMNTKKMKTALLAGVAACAFAASPILAEETAKMPATETMAEKTPSLGYKLDISPIETVDANIDAETIREIISGRLVENADALATLNAKKILIPEVKVSSNFGAEGVIEFTIKNVMLNDVRDGFAQTASVGSISTHMPENRDMDIDASIDMVFDEITYRELNLGAILAAYGLVPAQHNEMRSMYKSYQGAGGTLDIIGQLHCDFGRYYGGEDRARPMKVSYLEAMTIISELEQTSDPSPEQLKLVLDFYADLLLAFETSPATLEGIDCAGAEDEQKFKFSMGKATIGAMGGGVYPSFAINDIMVNFSGDETGSFELGNFTFKEIDFNPTINAYHDIEDISQIDGEWFEENWRSFMPSFAGMSLSKLDVDVPNDDEREIVKLENLDVSLAEYINGVPSDILLVMSGFEADVPEKSRNDGFEKLVEMGVEHINAGYEFRLNWDQTKQAINLARLMITEQELGTIDASGLIVGASKDLFALDPQMAMISAMGLGLREMALNVDDKGIVELVMAQAAKEQGAPADAFRAQASAMAQGMIVGFLGAVKSATEDGVVQNQAIDLGEAVGRFLKGDAHNLNVEVTSKSETGVGMPQIIALQTDPTQLLKFVDINSSAK